MKTKIFLLTKEIDKIELSKEASNRFSDKISFLVSKARELKREGKLSQTMVNRISKLWLLLPREKELRELIDTEQYYNLLKIQPIDLEKLGKALSKELELIKSEGSLNSSQP